MMSMSAADDDPRPEPPLPPAPDACCGSGCNPCVFDLYDEALERYRAGSRLGCSATAVLKNSLEDKA